MSNKKFIVDSNQAPRAIGPYSQAVGYDGLLHLSQQLPVDPRTGRVSPAGVEQQTRLMMDNVQGILMAAGLDFSHILKTTIYLRNLNDFELMSEIYALYFDHSPPARSVVEVNRLLHDALVAIDVVAAVPADHTSGREDANYDDVEEDAPVVDVSAAEEEDDEPGIIIDGLSEEEPAKPSEADASDASDEDDAPSAEEGRQGNDDAASAEGAPEVEDALFDTVGVADADADADEDSEAENSAASLPGLKGPPGLPPLKKLPVPGKKSDD